MLPISNASPDVTAIHLADIKNTLVDIRRNTFLTKNALVEKSKQTSAEEARQGIKERTAIEKPMAAGATGTAEESKKASKGILDFFKDFSFTKFLKIFGLLGIGVLFREKIFEFLKGAFQPLANFVSKWWKEDLLPALQGLGKAILGDKFYEFLFGKEGEKGLFSKAADEIGKFYTANIKPLFESIAATETFKSLKTYVSGISDGLKQVGVALGIINEDGTVSTAGWLVGAGAFAALFAIKGPFKLLASGFELMGNIALLPFKGAATGIKLLSKMGVGLAGIAWDGVKAGFNAIRGMRAAKTAAATGTFADIATGNYGDDTKTKGKGGGFFKRLGFPTALGFAKAAIIPLLAIGAVAAAVFGLKTLYDKEQNRKSQQVADATEGGLFSQEQLAFAKQQATSKVTDLGDKRMFGGYDEGEGAGTFEEYLKFRGETIATGDSVAAQKQREEQRARYDKARAEYEKAIEKERVSILNSLIDSRRQNQLQMLGNFMSGPFQRMIAAGAVKFDDGVDASSSMKALMAWMNQSENTGKPITLDVLKDVGGITIDPNQEFKLLDRTGSGEYETRLGGVSTLEDIGRVGEMIKTRSTVRDSLEAVRNVAPGSGSGVNQGKVSTISKDAAVNAVAAKASGAAPSVVVAQPPPAPPAKSGDKTDTVIIEMGKTKADILRATVF